MTQEGRLLTRPFVWLVCAHFLQALGYASMVLLPLYLAHLGADHATIGAVMGVAAVSGLVSRPLVGWALDRFGRHPVLVAGTFVMVAGMAALGAVTRIGPLLVASRLVFGVGVGVLLTGYFVLAADIVPPRRRSQGIALFGISGLLPLALQPLTLALGVHGATLRWLYPAAAALVLLSLLPLRAVPSSHRVGAATHLRPRIVLRSLAARPLRPVWLAVSLFGGLVAIFMAFATVVAAERGVPNPAVVWVAYPAAAAAVRLVGGHVPDRVGTRHVVGPALACYLAAMGVAAVSHRSGGWVAAGLLAGVGHGYAFPVLTALMVERIAPAHRGSGMATFTALWSAAELALPPLMGHVGDRLGAGAIFAVAAAAGTLTLGAWAILEWRTGRQAARPRATQRGGHTPR